MQILADRLRALRENLGKTQPEVAQDFGVTVSALQGWEAGRRDPSPDLLVQFSRYFNVSADYLLGISDEPAPIDSSSAPARLPRMARWLRAALAEKRVRLAAVARSLQMSESMLRQIHDGTSLYVPPMALRELAGYFGVAEETLLEMAPQGPLLANQDPESLIGVVVDSDQDLTDDDRKAIRSYVHYLRAERRGARALGR